MIIIPRAILEDMVAQARAHAPLEACGLLAGRDSSVKKIYRMTNIDASAEHFSLDPKEQFAAAKDMRAEGLEMMAVYHSHPATPAQMSEEDLRLALTPDIRYVIVSLMNPDRPEIRSYRVENGDPSPDQVLIQCI